MPRSSRPKRKRAHVNPTNPANPAILRTDDGYKHSWRDPNGNLHRDGGLPSVILVHSQHMHLPLEERDHQAHYQAYYEHGFLHRDGGLPAEKWMLAGQVMERYWVRGKLHRGDWDLNPQPLVQLPAIVDGLTGDMFNNGVYQGTITSPGHNGGGPVIKWYECRGVNKVGRSDALHRDDDLPAWIILDADGITVISESWYLRGQLHRPGDQPAVVHHITGRQEWHQLDRFHRDHDRPAVVVRGVSEEWYTHGLRSRIGAPAVVRADGSWEWWLGGERHRLNGPCRSDANDYCVNGRLHREGGLPARDNAVETMYKLHALYYRADGPAHVVRRDGVVIYQLWCTGTPGKPFRIGGPALIAVQDRWTSWEWMEKPGVLYRHDGGPNEELYSGDVLFTQRWWIQDRDDPGDRRLSRTSGPAIIRVHSLHREWWLNGVNVSERMHGKVVRWIKRSITKMRQPYLEVGSKLVQVKSLYSLL